MSAESIQGPRQWETLLAASSRETRNLVYVACADCRERHFGWCPEQLIDGHVCPLGEPGGWARPDDVLP